MSTSNQSRLKSGKEYSSSTYIQDFEWVCESYLAKLKTASEHPKASAKLKEFVTKFSAFKFEKGVDICLPHTAATQIKLDEDVRKIKDRFESHIKRSPSLKDYYTNAIERQTKELSIQHAPKRKEKWIFIKKIDRPTWTENPAKASMLPFEVWEALKNDLSSKQLLMQSFSALEKEAVKLGVSFIPDELPRMKKLTPNLQKIIESDVEVFDASNDYLSKTCLAVYVKYNHGDSGGFLSANKTAGSDLANARLFASKKDAKKFMGSYKDYALVEVEVHLKSFEVIGKPNTGDLEATMSRRESLDIEEALKEANVEQLKAALKALQDKVDPESSDIKSEKPAKKSNRL